jgi:hypothetical protein
MKTQFFPQTSSYPVAQGADTCHDVVSLHGKEILSLKSKGEQINLKCLGGAAWITLPGDPDDHILQMNDTFAITQKGLVLVQAMPETVICM